jgi:hypothetical protein
MAAYEPNTFDGPVCSIAEAILWVAYRDVARVLRDAPSLFALQEWPDEVTKALWTLLRALTRGTVHSSSSYSRSREKPLDAIFYRQVWESLKDAEKAIGRTVTLPVKHPAGWIEGLEGMRTVRSDTTTFHDFIRAVEGALGFIDIDTDSLVLVFLAPGLRLAPAASATAVDAAPLHREGKSVTMLEAMILDVYATGEAKNEDDAFKIVLDDIRKKGLTLSRDLFDTTRKDLERKGFRVRGPVGRRRKNTPS